MKYVFACCTDKGAGRKRNQDALLVKQAVCKKERFLLAVVCDGMGGLRKGEVASTTLIHAFSEWFEQELPHLLLLSCMETELYRSWNRLLQSMNRDIAFYGDRNHFQLGTTVTALLFTEKKYYMVHVGDSRAYEIGKSIRQLTVDQTVVQQEVERGILTQAEARKDGRRNVLLQCVGASAEVVPVFRRGEIHKNMVYMLCCDGFWHEVSEKEIRRALRPSILKDETLVTKQLNRLVRLNKIRGEQDDISVIAVRTF